MRRSWEKDRSLWDGDGKKIEAIKKMLRRLIFASLGLVLALACTVHPLKSWLSMHNASTWISFLAFIVSFVSLIMTLFE